jgi:hypothetical protein
MRNAMTESRLETMHDAFTELAKRRTHLERLAAELPERSTFNMLWGVTTNLIERGVHATSKETASEILERLIGKLTMDWKYANMEDAQGSPDCPDGTPWLRIRSSSRAPLTSTFIPYDNRQKGR